MVLVILVQCRQGIRHNCNYHCSSRYHTTSQVTGLTVTTVSSIRLNLAWTQNTESDLNQYNVYRGTTSGFSVTPGVTPPAGTSTANSYSSTGLSPSTTYYYKVAPRITLVI